MPIWRVPGVDDRLAGGGGVVGEDQGAVPFWRGRCRVGPVTVTAASVWIAAVLARVRVEPH